MYRDDYHLSTLQAGMRLRDFFWDVTAVTDHDTTDATVAQAVTVLESATPVSEGD